MLDEELMEAISEDLPDIPYVFISSVTSQGITLLKDIIWRELNNDDFIPKSVSRHGLIHRNLDISNLEFEPEDEIPSDIDDDYDDDLEEYDSNDY